MKQTTVFLKAIYFLMSLVGLSTWSVAATPDVAVPAHPELVVSTKWLSDHLTDPHLVIVHVGHDEKDYQAGHIPGAIFLSTDKIATSHTEPGTELLPPEELKKNLELIGIGDSSRVVYYSPDWDPIATRLFFTMDYLGHGGQAALLDGGLDQWIREKRPTTTDAGTVKSATLTVHLHPEIVTKIDYMEKLVAQPDSGVVILDARPSKRYRNGHLRAAESLYWENALVSDKDPLLKSPVELRQLFTAVGVTGQKKAVSYCEVGLQASYVYFLARYLGIDAAMYDGSYREWSEANQPVIRGDSRQ
jgi:thiosulfate/3-mercaptopyruvate sulfurtransferase